MAVTTSFPPLLEAHGVSVRAGGRTILQPTSLRVGRGELLALIGQSGSGKTTLVRALAGVSTPSEGVALLDGNVVQRRRRELAYVPQDDIVHPLLTVREALNYGAALRLPRGTRRAEIGAAVERVLGELGIAAQADQAIAHLSGGQRKRVNVATELLTQPRLMFLDEPTTGLDPALERRTMVLLREIADNGRGVVVVTHATNSLELADTLLVMGQGGRVCFHGSPEAARAYFGVDELEEIYTALERVPVEAWIARGGGAPAATAPATTDEPRKKIPRRRRSGPLRQFRVLVARYVRLLSRDRRNLLIVVGQVPVIAFAIVGLFRSNALERVGGRPGDAAQLLFMLVTAALWFGSIGAAREIVKERAVYLREAAVGLRPSLYVLSKLLVLLFVVAGQVLILAAIVFALRPLDERTTVVATVLGLLVATALVAVALGLLISASVGTQEQATSLLPLVLIPQLLFAGAIIPTAAMSKPVAALSSLAFEQWSFAGVGAAIDMNARIAADRAFAAVNSFGTAFFGTRTTTALGVLGIFLVVFAGGAWLVLRVRTE